MSKKLIILNGTAGVGKTVVSKALYQQLDDSVWLDGDWCWMMHPWNITAESKQMVEKNICYLLNSFIHNSSFQNIVFCWVMHHESILQRLLEHLDLSDCEVYAFSLVCQPETLQARLNQRGATPAQVETCIGRLQNYLKQGTVKIDTTEHRIEDTVTAVLQKLEDPKNVYHSIKS